MSSRRRQSVIGTSGIPLVMEAGQEEAEKILCA